VGIILVEKLGGKFEKFDGDLKGIVLPKLTDLE
jgi:hypothetical protein